MHDATVIASLIAEAFADYHAQFAAITRRARRRFEQRDWSAAREDAVQRIALYDACINECRLRLQAVLGERKVVRTREPGGSKGAEVIRNLVVATDAEPWSAMTETLLMYASRSDHLERTIRPALAAGDWVVCDRFADSSRAYQGAGGGVAQSFIEQIDAGVVGDDQPDLTLVFDLPVEVVIGAC